MNHRQFSEWLKLSIYDELTDDEKKGLNRHLKSCDACRVELENLKKFHALFAHRKTAPEKSMLLDSRRTLRLKIHDISAHTSVWGKLKGAIDEFLAPPLRTALAGIATLAVGFVIGYFAFYRPAENSSWLQKASFSSPVMEAGEPQIADIRFIDRDTQTGNIEFTFETITPVHVRGNVNDENVQRVLARALVSNQNSGVRLKAVNIIGSPSEQKSGNAPKLDEEVKSALITALLYDKNLGVRREALDVLKRYLPDPAIVHAFLNVLANEKNAGLKIAAINSLDVNKYQDQPLNREIMDMLKQKAESDDNNYIKIKAKLALQEVNQ